MGIFGSKLAPLSSEREKMLLDDIDARVQEIISYCDYLKSDGPQRQEIVDQLRQEIDAVDDLWKLYCKEAADANWNIPEHLYTKINERFEETHHTDSKFTLKVKERLQTECISSWLPESSISQGPDFYAANSKSLAKYFGMPKVPADVVLLDTMARSKVIYKIGMIPDEWNLTDHDIQGMHSTIVAALYVTQLDPSSARRSGARTCTGHKHLPRFSVERKRIYNDFFTPMKTSLAKHLFSRGYSNVALLKSIDVTDVIGDYKFDKNKLTHDDYKTLQTSIDWVRKAIDEITIDERPTNVDDEKKEETPPTRSSDTRPRGATKLKLSTILEDIENHGNPMMTPESIDALSEPPKVRSLPGLKDVVSKGVEILDLESKPGLQDAASFV